MIREKKKSDIKYIMEIWLQGNLQAHKFIKESYWIEYIEETEKAIEEAEVFVYEEQGEIIGFIGIQKNYIAGLFIKEEKQQERIGSRLIEFCKQRKSEIFLYVYKENEKAVTFYLKHKFQIEGEYIEKGSLRKEYKMEWKK